MKRFCRLVLVWLGLFSLQSHAHTLLVIVPAETALTSGFVDELKREHADARILVHSLTDVRPPAVKPTLIITMGITSLQWRLDQPEQTPTIATYVSRSGLRTAELPTLPAHARAVLANPKPERQLRLAERLIPHLRGAGMLHSKTHAQQIPEWTAVAAATEIKLNITELVEPEDLAQVLVSVLDRSDVLIGLDDPIIYNADNLKTILLTNYTRDRVLWTMLIASWWKRAS
jgi:hypothetical protein